MGTTFRGMVIMENALKPYKAGTRIMTKSFLSTSELMSVAKGIVRDTTLPRTTLPRTTLPRTTLPRTTLPRTTLPRTTLPRATLPRTTLPRTTLPRIQKTTLQ
ncbi:unnamed protein product [Didymodactylos carnosus]|uniref:Uncharacterized protein n=1 Tax=Didymodactylos carnosus TaxID=1234261 RepID=A0A8S2LD03_9BILA|nr:unnamed protein product [Didymodactylos carnosus]CAF3896866.1 unnamed protein product [Didymodactylos carnosus]